MKKVLFWSKHKPTRDQADDAKATFDAELVHIPAEDSVNPRATRHEVREIAAGECNKILGAYDEGAVGVVLGGGLPELWVYMIPALRHLWIYTSTTERVVTEGPEGPDGKKTSTSVFKHIQYRLIQKGG